MFGPIGGPEFLLILVLALLLFGPRKLPQIGRTIGKALAEFRGATNEFRASLERDVEIERVRQDRAALAEFGREVEHTLSGSPRSVAPAGPALVPGARAGDHDGDEDDGEPGGQPDTRHA